MKWGLKGGISINADSGPPRYVLWCCGGIWLEVLTFIQIGCGHTVYVHFSHLELNFQSFQSWWDTLYCWKCDDSIAARAELVKYFVHFLDDQRSILLWDLSIFSIKGHSIATANLNKSEDFVTNNTAASKYIPRRPRISINWNPPFQTQIYLVNSKK